MRLWIIFVLLSCCYAQQSPLAEVYRLEQNRQDISKLWPYIQNSNQEVALAAVRALGRLQDLSSIPVLGALAENKNPDLRAEAAFALGQLWSNQAESTLLQFLSDENSTVKEIACEGLGKCGTAKSIDYLIKIIKGKKAVEEAILAIGFIGKRGEKVDKAIVPLGQLSQHKNPQIRWRCQYAFFRMKNKTALPYIQAALNDEEPLVQVYAIRALNAIDPGSIHITRVKARDWRARVEWARALAKNPDVRSLSILLKLLDDDNLQVKITVVQILQNLSSSTMPVIKQQLCQIFKSQAKSAEPIVLGHALLAMTKFHAKKAKKLLINHATNDHPIVRLYVAKSLQYLPETDQQKLFEILQKTRDKNAIREASISLIKAQNKETLPKILSLLSQHDMAITTTIAEKVTEWKVIKALPALIAEYKNLKTPDDVEPMVAIINAVGKIGDKRHIAFLEQLAKEDSTPIRQAATKAWEKITGKKQQLKSTVKADNTGFKIFPFAKVHEQKTAHVTVKTNRGSFVIKLYLQEAPGTATNFLTLAQAGYYDNLTFHRLVANFVIQGGDPRGDGWGGPGYAIRCEYNRKKYVRGTVGMPLAGKDTGGCQLFITHSPQPHLDGRYTVFGQVTSGMDIVDQLMEGDKIISIKKKE